MKKNLTLFLIITFALLSSCSSDESETSDNNTATPIDQVPPIVVDTATGSIDGDAFSISPYGFRAYCYRDGEKFILSIYGLEITFNKYGTLGTAEYERSVQGYNFIFRQPFFNSSSSVNFTLESLDLVNKRVKGQISGTLFNSNSQAIDQELPFNCEFNVKYNDRTPLVNGVHHSAQINGVLWNYSNEKKVFGINWLATRTYVSDNADNIILTYSTQTIGVGQYNFNPDTSVNKIQFARFNQSTQQNVIYNSTGTLNVTKRENVNSSVFILTGTYNLTAVNPNNAADVVMVTNGDFKQLMINY